MPATLPIARPPLGRTFRVALGVLGVIGVVQVGSVALALFERVGRVAPPVVPPGRLVIEKAVDKDDALNIASDPVEETGREVVRDGGGISQGVPPRPQDGVKTDLEVARVPQSPYSGVPGLPDGIVAGSVPGGPQPGTVGGPDVPVRPVPNGAVTPGPTPLPGSVQPGVAPTPGSAALHKPTPVPNETFFPSAPQSRVQELVQQGKQLRTKGDTQAAITRFREAQVIEPANPESTAELALTYEKMGLAERAGEQWRRIIALGEAAGPYLMTANAKMDMAKLEMLRNQPTSASGTLPSVPGGTSDSGLTSGNTAALIPEGKTLGVGDPSLVEGNDPGLSKKLTLSLPLLARPGRTVQVNQVVAQVLFYDTVNGKDPVKTAANVRYRWGSPPADWANGRDEVLEVDYELPKPDPRDPRAQKRKYLGYIVRLYYRGELQDSRADPRTLGTQFPPPRLLNPE